MACFAYMPLFNLIYFNSKYIIFKLSFDLCIRIINDIRMKLLNVDKQQNNNSESAFFMNHILRMNKTATYINISSGDKNLKFLKFLTPGVTF